MTEEEFEQMGISVNSEKEQNPAEPKTMWDRANLVWSQIQLGRYNPKEEESEVEAWHELTLAEVQSFSMVSF
jgi:secreted Zn-dependent insulinase-like peptidase